MTSCESVEHSHQFSLAPTQAKRQLTNMRHLEDPHPPAIGLDAIQVLLELNLPISLPLLDRRSISEVIPSLVDFESVVLEMVMELVQE